MRERVCELNERERVEGLMRGITSYTSSWLKGGIGLMRSPLDSGGGWKLLVGGNLVRSSSSYERKQTAAAGGGEGEGGGHLHPLTPLLPRLTLFSRHRSTRLRPRVASFVLTSATSPHRTSHLALGIIYLENKAQTERYETTDPECEDTNSSPC